MNKTKNELQVTNAEISSMVRDLDEINMDVAMPAMTEAGAWLQSDLREEAEAAEGLKGRRLGRRTFLLGAGAAAGGLALAACGTKAATPSTSPTTASNVGSTATDLAVNALATSLENQAVTTYGNAVKAVVADKFGNVPGAIAHFALVAQTQHAQHAVAWNAQLTAAGKAKVTTGPQGGPYSDAVVASGLAKIVAAGDLTKLLNFALLLENQAASTYQVASTILTTAPNIALAASIQPVEMQHSAIIYFALGMYPGIQTSSGPVAFNPTGPAAMTSYYTGPL